MSSFRQSSFSGGIIGPQLLGKVQQEKYQAGLRDCLNWQITRFGSIENRAGTEFIGEVKDSSNKVREIPFIFNSDISYLMEYGADYIRPWNQGARIDVTGAAAYAGGTTYAIGDLVTSGGIVYWSIQAGNIGHTPASSAAYWYPQVGGLLEIKTIIPQDSLALLQYVQQNDVMTLAQQAIPPQQVIRSSNVHWAFQAFTQSTGIDAPTALILTIGVGPTPAPVAPTGFTAIGGAGAAQGYAVSAYTGGAEGPVCTPINSTGGQADAFNPVALAWNVVGGASGYVIYSQIGLNPNYYIIGIADTNAYTDDGIALGYPVRTVATTGAPGAITFTYVVTAVSATNGAESLASARVTGIGKDPTSANPNIITWAAVADAVQYNVYRIVNEIPGYVGSVSTTSFLDTNIAPDTALQPPTPLVLFDGGNYPGAVGYYQQRLAFGNFIDEPQTVKTSNIGNYSNFTDAIPITDDAAVSFTIAGKQVQAVRALIDLGKLIIHTSGDEYVAAGNQSGALTPTGIGLVHQGSAGCAPLAPVIIGNIGIFVQARGSVLRDLEYSIYTTSFKGRDLTVFAPHLFAGRTIVDMTWQQIPNSIVWCVMSDGALLGLTYIKDHDIWAWHRHDSDGGLFENVCVVPEGQHDSTYFIVKRTINGATKRYIERLASREFTDIDDAWFVDCGLSYDGRNTGVTTMTATTSGGWTPQDDLTMTASVGYFVSGDVGNEIVFQQIADGTTSDADGVRIAAGTVTDAVGFGIIAYTDTQHVTVQADRDVPTWARVALTTWGKAVDTFAGLSHLEGCTVVGLGDGNVIPEATVTGGSITTAINYLRATIGLPITADIETLPIENTQGETLSNKQVIVTEVTPIFYNSRGGEYGMDAASVKPWIQRQSENWNEPVTLYTGPRRIPISGTWQKTGQIFVRQSDPLPIGISAIVPLGSVGNSA